MNLTLGTTMANSVNYFFFMITIVTSTFLVSFTTTDFVLCKSGVLLVLHHKETVLLKFGPLDTLSCKLLKNVKL